MDVDWDLVDATLHTSASGATSRSSSRAGAPGRAKTEQEKRDERNMQLAVHHATLLQQRKDVEAANLQATIELIDFPRVLPPAPSQSSSAPNGSTNGSTSNASALPDPAHPDPRDAEAVKTLMRDFQPANLEELVVERNLEGKCGYVLCPRPYAEDRRLRGSRLTLLMDRGGGASSKKESSVRVVKTKDLMRWCGPDCARRAMYLRVQLDEKPAWERAYSDRLQLYGEDDEDEDPHQKARDEAVGKMTEDLRKLAIERGRPDVDKVMDDFQKMSIPYR